MKLDNFSEPDPQKIAAMYIQLRDIIVTMTPEQIAAVDKILDDAEKKIGEILSELSSNG